MRNVESHLLEDKMDEAVTHYINSQPAEAVHVDANSLALNIQDDGGGRVVTLMHSQNFQSQMCRQISVGEQVGEGPWVDDLLDPEGRLAVLMAHLTQNSRVPHHQSHAHHKISTGRSDVDGTVILDTPYGQSLEAPPDSMTVQVPSMPPLPPLQDMKRCQETDWFDKDKAGLKNDSQILSDQTGGVLEMCAGASPANKQHSKKSLPHKKRISKKLKRNNGGSTPQQDIVVINCQDEGPHEEILPDTFTAPPTHQMRPLLICQLCGEFYGDEQLKFYHHLKQHYEPHTTIIIENPVADLAIDKMTNTCIVDNVATLPDSIVELTLENTVPKTMYQEKHLLYNDKALYSNKVQYLGIDKDIQEAEKSDLYSEDLDKIGLYCCVKCNKSFKKQKLFETHVKEAHSNAKLEDMGEFSETEDLMEGIHVAVDDAEQYEQALLPHLVVDNGHVRQDHTHQEHGHQDHAHQDHAHQDHVHQDQVHPDHVHQEHGHQDHVRTWYMRNVASGTPVSPLCECGGAGYCDACAPHVSHTHVHTHTHAHMHLAAPQVSHMSTHSMHAQVTTHSQVTHGHGAPHAPVTSHGPVTSHAPVTSHPPVASHAPVSHSPVSLAPTLTSQRVMVLKEEVLQRIFDTEVQNTDSETFTESIIEGAEVVEPAERGVVKTERMVSANVRAGEGATAVAGGASASVGGASASVGKGKASEEKKQKRFECGHCSRVFEHRNSLLYHVLMHSGRQHTCRECGKSFYTTAALKIHKRVHTDYRPCKCDECGREFKQASDLKYHKTSIHSAQKNYKCEFCGKEFARRYSLSIHRRIHTGERNYQCDYCPKTFRASSYRLTHMRTHTGTKPHKCTQCDKRFRVAYDLRRHLKIHEKSRNKLDEQKNKPKDNTKEKKTNNKLVETVEESDKAPIDDEKTKSPLLKSILDKKQAKPRKAPKKPPNVTVQSKDGQFKISEYDDAYVKQEQYTKDVYEYKDDTPKKINYAEERSRNQEKERNITHRPIYRNQQENDRLLTRETTDGKMPIFTQVEKKEYSGPIVSNTVSLSDIRSMDRDVNRDRSDLHSEAMESGFFERLTSLYNIPAV